MAANIQVIPVTQLPPNSWFEGFVIRPNGHILATRLDKPELYTFDPSDPNANPKLIHTFPDANGLVNICPIQGASGEEYAVIAGGVDLQAVQFDSGVIWRVALRGEDAPIISKIAHVPESGFCIGVTSACPRTLLVADSYKDCIWRLDTPTGKTSVLVTDDTMKAATADDYFGINRIRMAHGYIWYTNTSAGLLCRVPVEPDEEVGIRTTGPVEIISAALSHCDGLVVLDEGRTVLAANYMAGALWKIDIDAEGKGTPTIFTKGLNSPTGIEAVKEGDSVKLFVACCGETEVGWVNEGDKLAIVRDVEVNVTVEVDE